MSDIKDQMIYYDRLWTERKSLNSLQLRRALTILKYISLIIRKQKKLKVLDMGCGDGRFSGFTGEFVELDAIELSSKAVDNAKKNYPHVNFFQGSALDYNFKSNYYDVIISQEVIEHIEEQEKYLNVCHRALKKNGFLIITTPNKKVLDHMEGGSWSNQPIEKTMNPREFKAKVSAKFNIKIYESIIYDFGKMGYFKFFNSRYFISFFNKTGLNFIREFLLSKLGFGLHQCILATKK